MPGLHRASPRSLGEAPVERVGCCFRWGGGPALRERLRTEFSSADLLPALGVMNCLFAQRL